MFNSLSLSYQRRYLLSSPPIYAHLYSWHTKVVLSEFSSISGPNSMFFIGWCKHFTWGMHYIPVRCAPVLAVLAVMHAFCLRPDYRYLVCRIATYLSVFYNQIAICSKLSVYCYFVRHCLCVGILFKIALVLAAKTIMLEHCPIFVVFVVTYT